MLRAAAWLAAGLLGRLLRKPPVWLGDGVLLVGTLVGIAGRGPRHQRILSTRAAPERAAHGHPERSSIDPTRRQPVQRVPPGNPNRFGRPAIGPLPGSDGLSRQTLMLID
jgi:hypothetical protein